MQKIGPLRLRVLTVAFAAAVLCQARTADAVPIRVEWQGDFGWYNGDALAMCQEGTLVSAQCDFFYGLETLGLPLDYSAPKPVVTLGLTMEGSRVLDANSALVPTVIDLTVAGLSFRARPSLFAFSSAWAPDPTIFGVVGTIEPAIADQWRPGSMHLWLTGVTTPPTGSLEAWWLAMLLNPPRSGGYCVAFISGDCDIFGGMALKTVTRLPQVPEPTSLLMMVPMLPVALVRSRLRKRSKER